ncbi:MAG: N-acetylneuraminate synthase family protein [Termitinemataceae bacterium]
MNHFCFTPFRPLIIAELGTGHGGSLDKARELVDAAIEAGADCIKFQLVYAEEILHPNTGEVPLPGGRIRLFDRFKELEVPLTFYEHIKAYIEGKGKLFLCTPFGKRSAAELFSLSPQLIKIASPELNYVQLLEQVASYRLPTILSSGVSRLADIEEALSWFTPSLVCLLHCVTAYPAPEEDYNIRILENLSRIFGVSVGVSDHSMDPELVPVLATVYGASVIEKHFCLSRSDPGLDDPIALPPHDFARMVQAVRAVQHQLSRDGEERSRLLQELSKRYGTDRIEAVLGDGIKRLAESEKANYDRTNRSIHAVRDLPAGTVLTANDMAVLRTEKILRPGLHPRWFNSLVGRSIKTDIPAGEGIRFEDV